MVDTPFERTRPPLRDWFQDMFLFCTTRQGVAANDVQRQLGVTCKTARKSEKIWAAWTETPQLADRVSAKPITYSIYFPSG